MGLQVTATPNIGLCEQLPPVPCNRHRTIAIRAPVVKVGACVVVLSLR